MSATQEQQLERAKAAVYEPKEMARRIRAARGYAGIAQTELAKRLGISTTDVRRWEEPHPSKAGLPLARRRRFLHDVAEVCDISRSWIKMPGVDISRYSEDDRTIERAIGETDPLTRQQIETMGVEALDPDLEAEELEADEAREAQRQSGASDRPSEAPGREAASQ